jgi:hypothetical protein
LLEWPIDEQARQLAQLGDHRLLTTRLRERAQQKLRRVRPIFIVALELGERPQGLR